MVTRLIYQLVTGSGNIYTIKMIVEKAETTLSGNSNIEFTTNNQLKGIINGSGSVYCRDTPVITTTIAGRGAVITQ